MLSRHPSRPSTATRLLCLSGLLASSGAAAATFIPGGNVSGTWNLAGNPYTVTASATVVGSLTVEAGVTVYFKPATSLQVPNGATLITQGTPGNDVIFTSDNINLPGGPHAGDWLGILLNGNGVANLAWTDVRYGGGGGFANLGMVAGSGTGSLTWNGGSCESSGNDGIRVDINAVSLTNLLVDTNAQDGIEVGSVQPCVFDLLTLNNNTARAMAVNSGPGNFPATIAGDGNGTDGIYVNGTLGGSASDRKWTWNANFMLPYVVNQVTVNGADSLEFATGDVVKFWTASSALTFSGSTARMFVGTPGYPGPVWFTSLKDDTQGGDTNNNGSATAPAPGDWTAVFLNNSAGANCREMHLAYGGAGNNGNLCTNTQAATLVWDMGESSRSANDGVRLSTSSTVTLTNLSFLNNAADGLELTPSIAPTLDNIVSSNNTGRAIAINTNPGSVPNTISGSGNGTNGIYLSGSLGTGYSDRKWTWGDNPTLPYIVGNVVCASPDSLELAAGTVVKFNAAGSNLQITGAAARLTTLGTGGQPVWFTSMKDDTQHGDTNGNGGANAPAAGDWQTITLDNSAGATLSSTFVAYGGSGGLASVGTVNTAGAVAWTNGGVSYSGNDGVRLTTTACTLSGLTVVNNAVDGLELSPATPPVLDHIVASNNVARAIAINQNPGSFPATLGGSGNGTNGIYLTGTLGTGAADRKWTWGANANFPYVVNTLTVNSPDSLELAAGTVVKMWTTGAYMQSAGTAARLITLGTPSNPVWFTSLKDDAQGGDTNGNGAANVPAPGDFVGLLYDAGAGLSLQNTWVSYGGNNPYGNVYTATSGTLSWIGGGSQYSSTRGIFTYTNAATLNGLRVSFNTGDGVQMGGNGGTPLAVQCDFSGNTGRGFVNTSTTPTITAINNWWGSVNGPHDPSAGPPDLNVNPSGAGVSDYVSYRPWLGSNTLNQPPSGFALVAPAEGDSLPWDNVPMRWRRSVDPEAAPVTYTLVIDDDPAFGSPVVSVAGLTDTTYDASSLVLPHTTYWWKVTATDGGGAERVSAPESRSFRTQVGPVAAGEPVATSWKFAVRALTSNPAPGNAVFSLTLPGTQRVHAAMVDVRGRHVRLLADGSLTAGPHILAWDGADDARRPVASGLYVLTVRAASGVASRRVLLTR